MAIRVTDLVPSSALEQASGWPYPRCCRLFDDDNSAPVDVLSAFAREIRVAARWFVDGGLAVAARFYRLEFQARQRALRAGAREISDAALRDLALPPSSVCRWCLGLLPHCRCARGLIR